MSSLLFFPALDVSLAQEILSLASVDVSLAHVRLRFIGAANLTPISIFIFPALDVSLGLGNTEVYNRRCQSCPGNTHVHTGGKLRTEFSR